VDDKVLDKLQKIIRILDGAKTEGEAAAALNRASAILDGSGLTLEEFRERFGAEAEEKPEEVEICIERGSLYIRAARISSQHGMAVDVVTAVCGLEQVFYTHADVEGVTCLKFIVVGTPEALTAAGRLLRSVMASAHNICKHWKDTNPKYQQCPWARRKLSADFLLGFWSGLLMRAKENAERKPAENTTTAIVRASDIIRERTSALAKEAKTKINRAFASRISTTRTSANIKFSGAFQDGIDASNKVSLNYDKQKQLC
jgi:hypothetical protein